VRRLRRIGARIRTRSSGDERRGPTPRRCDVSVMSQRCDSRDSA
jgi:hypothetical protein